MALLVTPFLRHCELVCSLDRRAMKFSHATPLLTELHWVSIPVRMEFKILLLTHRTLPAHATQYTEQCVSRRQPVWPLRSDERNLSCVPNTRRHWGDIAFRVTAPMRPVTNAASKVKLMLTYFQ